MRHKTRAARYFFLCTGRVHKRVDLLRELDWIIGVKRSGDRGEAKHGRSGKSGGFRGLAFNFQSFLAVGIEKYRDLVAVLITALVDDSKHFGGGVWSEGESLDGHIVALGADGDLGDGGIDDGAFKFGELRPFVRLQSSHDNGNRGFYHRHGHGSGHLRVDSGTGESQKTCG